MHKLLPIVIVLALGGCAAPQDQVLKKMPGAQASNAPNCAFEPVLRTMGHATSAMVCH